MSRKPHLRRLWGHWAIYFDGRLRCLEGTFAEACESARMIAYYDGYKVKYG